MILSQALDNNMDNKEGDNMGAGEDNHGFEDKENLKCKEDPLNNKSYGAIDEKRPVEEPERQQWSNPIEFLLSCIAMSVISIS